MKKILHILYTDSSKGGAQNFAIDIAKKYNVITSSIRSGDGLKSRLLAESCGFIAFEDVNFADYDVVLLSDIRVLILSYWRILKSKYRISKDAPSNVRYIFIPHSDSLIKYSFLISLLKRFAKFEICATTLRQARSFRQDNWYLIQQISMNLASSVCKRYRCIVYHGRLEAVKQLDEIISWFAEARMGHLNGFRLLIVGDGSWECSDFGTVGVHVIRGWWPRGRLDKLLGRSMYVINFTQSEGISLQILEGISNGCIPIVRSKSVCENLFLDSGIHSPIGFSHAKVANFKCADALEKIKTSGISIDKVLQ